MRLGLLVGLLLAPLALGQPTTYTVPIVGRTPVANAVPGVFPVTEAMVLPALPAPLDQILVFGIGGDAPAVFRVAEMAPTTVVALPATADAMATAPGVLVNGQLSTVVAFSVGGAVSLGTLTTNTFVPQDAGVIPSTTLMAMTATADGGAALFVSDRTTITRWDIDGSGSVLTARKGFTISANPTSGGGADTPRVLVVDGLANGLRGVGYVGGGTVGDIYRFDAQLDAGDPTVFDAALVSQGRLAPPITGLALMQGSTSDYLLAANSQGLTVYDLVPPALADTLNGAFILRGADDAGLLTVPIGVAATNLPVSSSYPGGAIVVGNLGDRTLASLSWTDVAAVVGDGGVVVVDPGYDPRAGLVDGGTPDAGTPDGGLDGGADAGDGGGNGGLPPPNGPGIPVNHDTGCAAAGDASLLLPLLAVLALALLLRRRRTG